MSVDVAIIVPVYNEEDNILPLMREVSAAMEKAGRSYELVFVDDASADGTRARITEGRKLDGRVGGLRHERNSGQSAALWTGLRATTSPIVATLDGDLQNDPGELPRLLGELEGMDFVCGVREKRRDNFLRRVSSAVARAARKRVLGVDFADTGCAFRVFRREALEGVFPFNGLHRFLPILVHGSGKKTREVMISHRARVAGVSKYGVWNRLGRGMFDLAAMAWYQRRRITGVRLREWPEAEGGRAAADGLNGRSMP